MSLGQEHEHSARFKEAIQTYAVPLKDPQLSLGAATPLFRAIAGVYLKQSRLEEAIAYASLAYQIDPDYAQGLALIARIEYSRGKFSNALDAISRAARIDSNFCAERDSMKAQIQ
jgi:tetratricopeptide (TPR) repeat protein